MAEIAACCAGCIRVLTVADCQDEQLLPFFNHYHLFCLQPLSGDALNRLTAVADALAALALPADSRRLLLACTHLPLIPPVVQQLQQLLLDPDVRIDTLAALIEQDVVLSARLLQLANSAYMGFNQETASLQMAISRLGLNLLYGLVLALSISDTQSSRQQNSMRLAGHCRQVGAWLGLEQAVQDQAVLAALFYQLGHVLLQTASGDVRTVDPAQAAAFMLTLWGFSASTAQVLLAQQDITTCRQQPAALCLYLARQRQPLRAPHPELAALLHELRIRQHWPESHA